MFGAPKSGVLGAFDSKSEQEVARVLFALVREEYLRGVVGHPVVAGAESDFGVQLGPQSVEDQALMLVEYDGLGLSRPSGLGPKLKRYARLRRNGVYVRWATSTEKSHVRSLFTSDYRAPHFVRRIRVCDAGHEQTDVVIAPEKRGQSEIEQFISSSQCQTCNEQADDDAPTDKDGAS